MPARPRDAGELRLIRRLAALLCAAGCLWPEGAHALGRYCERVDDRCWDCADVAFGFTIPCDDDPCAPSEVCVQRDGAPECHVTTRLCCSEACTQPPGCEGAATACGGDSPDRPDQCTFLNDCPDPFPRDAGVNGDDAGPPVSQDGGAPPRDAGVFFDAAPPSRPPSFRGGGGCVCAAAPGAPGKGAWWLVSLACVHAFARRRRGRGRAGRGTRPACRAR